MSSKCDDMRVPSSRMSCLDESIYGDVLENINLGIIILDIALKRILFQNGRSRSLFANTDILKHYESVVSSLVPGLEEQVVRSGKIKSRELRLDSKIYGYSAYIISENYLCIFIMDITEKVRLQSIAAAVESMNNIGYVFSGIRHEVGNPINSAKTTLSVLKKNINNFSRERVLEYIERAQTEISRIEYLLHSLKNFNMYESPNPKMIDLPLFVEDFIALVKKDLGKKGITIQAFIQPKVKTAFIDPRALQQVMLNLVTNATDALEERKDPRILIEIVQTGKDVKIKIKDNGRGMTYEQKKNLFNPFCTTKTHGTGLGLVICRKMLAKTDSTIAIESRENVGTVVELSLPKTPVPFPK